MTYKAGRGRVGYPITPFWYGLHGPRHFEEKAKAKGGLSALRFVSKLTIRKGCDRVTKHVNKKIVSVSDSLSTRLEGTHKCHDLVTKCRFHSKKWPLRSKSDDDLMLAKTFLLVFPWSRVQVRARNDLASSAICICSHATKPDRTKAISWLYASSSCSTQTQ